MSSSSSSDDIMREMSVKKEEKEEDDDETMKETMSNHSDESENHSEGSKHSQIDLKQSSRSSSPTEVSLKRSKPKYQWIKRMVAPETPSLKSSDGTGKKINLKISNFPIDWTFPQIREFVIKEYGPVDNIYMACDEDCCFTGMIKLEFDVFDKCWTAWSALKGKMVEGVELHADSLCSDDGDSDEELAAKKVKKEDERWRPDIDVRGTDPKGMYGMKPQYLASLGIKPPLDKWVHVSNFRCDKSELKEVLELAGEVLICSIDSRGPKYAWVMYSHPLEAVQAVSMLNDQSFYGKNLKVRMERQAVGKIFLPKGLTAVGPGLGSGGKALRDIVTQYERFVKQRSSYVNSSIFVNPDLLLSPDFDVSALYGPKSVPDPKKSSKDPKSAKSPSSTDSSLDTPSPDSSNGAKSLPAKLSNTRVNSDFNLSNSCPFLAEDSSSTVPQSVSQSVSEPMSAPGTIPVLTSSVPRPTVAQIPGPIAGPNPIPGPSPMVGPSSVIRPGSMAAPSCVPRPGSVAGPTSMPLRNPTPGPSPIQGPSPMQSPGPISAPALRMPDPSAAIYQSTLSVRISNAAASSPNIQRAPMFRPQGPVVSQGPVPGTSWGTPGPMQGFNRAIRPQGTRPFGPGTLQPNNPTNDFATVELFNLPFNSTFALLSEKMAQCGQVISLQLTTPGCALVQFGQRAHAERCFQMFNQFRVGNNTIGVRFR